MITVCRVYDSEYKYLCEHSYISFKNSWQTFSQHSVMVLKLHGVKEKSLHTVYVLSIIRVGSIHCLCVEYHFKVGKSSMCLVMALKFEL